MKRLIPLFLFAFLLLLTTSAFSYEIQIVGNIPLSDNLKGIAINPTTGVAVAVSDETKTLYFIDIQHNTIIKNIPLDITPTGITFDITNNSVVVLSDNAVLQFIDPETGIIKHNSPLERDAGVCYIPTLVKGGEGGFSDNKSLIYNQ